jgi:exonuclease III
MPQRPRYELPDLIHEALNERGLMDAYRSRPAYQQNGYIGTLCVTRAKLETTKQKRLSQMQEELEGEKRYINIM